MNKKTNCNIGYKSEGIKPCGMGLETNNQALYTKCLLIEFPSILCLEDIKRQGCNKAKIKISDRFSGDHLIVSDLQ